MITFQKSFRSSDGKLHESLQAAQAAEIRNILFAEQAKVLSEEEVAERVLEKQKEIMDVLSTTESSRPKARSLHGGSKKRRKAEKPEIVYGEPTAA
jgi:ABC-type branched-subunit amino acid transport system ATPase component